MISYAVPVTQDELDEIERRSRECNRARLVPVTPAMYGRAIYVRGDGSALWALNQLADIRNTKREETQ